ncbi:MAG TPA: MraY family glycosyltransferase [Tepidisphaeraceae bacterium]|jgi:UDP-GlcNAc:undecaprenyl-phosphate GlcNAc-1-phosphate transferase
MLLAGGCFSFVLSLALTRGMIWLAPRIGFVDKPGHRKIHANPKPLGGGVAIFWSFAITLIIGAAVFFKLQQTSVFQLWNGDPSTEEWKVGSPLTRGLMQQMPLGLAMLAMAFAMHLMGLIDDKRTLGPYSKLIAQFGFTAALVIALEYLARQTPSLSLRILTTLDQYGLGPWPSIILTVLWITAITNAFNFLDNMDGLSAGVAAVCTTAFLVTALSIGQWFVAGTLAIFLGSLLGFLVWNFAPARIFMGDSGSLVVGFVLGVLTVRTTFLPPGESWAAGWYAVFAPVIVLAVPLYDLVVVSLIRLSRGDSPFKGDTNHFSHRLVARGMSRRTAVLCIYLVTAATSIAAILLPQVRSGFGAMLILLQTALVLGVVLLLEQHKPSAGPSAGPNAGPSAERMASVHAAPPPEQNT